MHTVPTTMSAVTICEIVDDSSTIFVPVQRNGLPLSDETVEPIARVYEDVPQLLVKVLDRKCAPADLRKRARDELGL